MNDCYSLIKATKKFEKVNLKNKIFKPVDEGCKDKGKKDKTMEVKKKKQFKEIFNEEMKQMLFKEFR